MGDLRKEAVEEMEAMEAMARCLLGGCIEGEDCPHPDKCWGLDVDAKADRALLSAAPTPLSEEGADGG